MDLRARWPAARAALIALVLAIGLVDGLPDPRQWAGGAAAPIDEVRGVLRRPVAWIGDDLDISQRWALFRGASRKRFRLYLEGKPEAGTWQLLHRAGDGEHAAYEDMLAYRRVRGTYSPSGQRPRSQYLPFASWMVQHMMDEHPELAAGRVRLERIVIGEGAYTPTGEFILEHEEPRRRR